MSNVLITGGTGFFGSELISEILSSSSDNINAIVRGKNATEEYNRLMSVMADTSKAGHFSKEEMNRVRIYTGDISKENLGLNKKDANYLINNIDTIYHCAAITNVNVSLEKIREVNVQGTKNVLDFALLCKKKGFLRRINHISTAFIAGTKNGIVKESDLEIGQSFNNAYEQSKYEAEQIVQKYRDNGLEISIFRPSIILGRFTDGKTTRFKMLYQPLHFFSLELMDRIPIVDNSKAYFVNVDIAAKAVLLISNTQDAKNMNYHITSPACPSILYILNIASEYFGFKMPVPIPLNQIDISKEYTPVTRKMIEPYLPYFNCQSDFATDNTMRIIEKQKFVFPKFDVPNFMRLFEYCTKKSFIKRKNNAVIG